MIEMLRRLLHIGRRSPPRLGDVAAFQDAALRHAARHADQEAAQRRRPREHDFLRMGDGYPE
jgi:hypothetical protein